jgi:hypothetical protein
MMMLFQIYPGSLRQGCWRGLVLYARVAGFLWLSCQCSIADTWHVSPQGNDGSPGTPAQPFATLGRAVEASRHAPPNTPRRIVLAGGDYFQVVVNLGPADSDLTIEAAPGTEPVLHGGQVLAGFRPLEGSLFVAASLDAAEAAANGLRMLWVNGRLAPRARFPATGRLRHRSEFKVGWMGTYGGGWERKPTREELTTLRVNPAGLGANFAPACAELTIFHEWDESLVGVRSYDATNGVIRFSSEAGHPPGAFGNSSFVVWNTRDGMTEPGQWFHDRERQRVVYWPLPGEDISKLRVIVPTTEALLRIQGGSNTPVRNLSLRGLTLAVANTPLKPGGFGAYAFEGAITAEHLEQCRFEELHIRHVGGQGIKLTQAAACLIEGCEIEDTGAGGVLCQDVRESTIETTSIHHVGRAYPSGIALTCTGVSNRIRDNFVHHTPYVGITADGSGACIESNLIERVMLELHDGAGIYLGGANHLVRANVCRDIGQAPGDKRHAYYMDELMRASRLEGNLAIRCPSPLHNHLASGNDIVNNVFVHDGDLRLSFFRCDAHRLERNLVVAGGRIDIYRPEAVSRWSSNLLFSRSGVVQGFPVGQYSAGAPFPLQVKGDSLNADPQLRIGDMSVDWAADSPAAALGIRPLNLKVGARRAKGL